MLPRNRFPWLIHNWLKLQTICVKNKNNHIFHQWYNNFALINCSFCNSAQTPCRKSKWLTKMCRRIFLIRLQPKMCRLHGRAEHKLSSEQVLLIRGENWSFFLKLVFVIDTFLQLTILLYKRRSRNLIVLYSVIKIEKFRFECNFCWGEDMKCIGILKCRPNPSFFKIYFLNLDTDQIGWEFLKLGVNLSMGFFSFSLFPSSSSSPFPLSINRSNHWQFIERTQVPTQCQFKRF